jgi:diaminohydroxyphosphoribosylaminopyrimidine deaminase / 5-amino-6-(5-phosphoribosylamino)uracil reductase
VAQQPSETVPHERDLAGAEDDLAWAILLGASQYAERIAHAGQLAAFGITREGRLQQVPLNDDRTILTWRPGSGWECRWTAADRRMPLMDLYLPICSATSASPVTVGHLGQSLDGFIATHAGESRWVTGRENLLHMHRLRALTDAVVVGAATVALDDPQLTTRLVAGPNPLRVVLDPGRRLGDQYKVFNDPSAETLYVCARSMVDAGPSRVGLAKVVCVDGSADGLDMHAVMRLLRNRGCTRIFVEGGGVTVSMFLEANLLDRLHMAIAPLLIGDGRPAIRLRPPAALGDCVRPRYRVFRMGGDVLFDCEFGDDARTGSDDTAASPSVTRVI